jgi:hypothetical protein
VRVSRWWSRALVCVSCVFWGALLDRGLAPPGVYGRCHVVLHVFCECFVSPSESELVRVSQCESE